MNSSVRIAQGINQALLFLSEPHLGARCINLACYAIFQEIIRLLGQTSRQCHAGLGGRDVGKRAEMSHIFADNQQHGFFPNRLLIGPACQQAMSARLVSANQR